MSIITNLDSKNFDSQVLNSELPVLVDFYADWCGPCQMAIPIIEELAEEYNGKLIIAKINVDKQADLAKRFEVMSIPTMIFFKDGDEIERKTGFGGKDALKQTIDSIL